MIEWGQLHPEIIHFVVALGLVGVALRLLSLTGKAAWSRPAGAVLLIITAVAAWAAVKSGHEAHELVERIPGGVGRQVQAHEEAGETTRNLFLVVGALELAGLALASRRSVQRWVLVASAVVGVVASYELYDAAHKGGLLVYNYAGGPGLRSGDTTDVRHLLVAGLFSQARVARRAGDTTEAIRLTQELGRQLPADPSVQALLVQSMIHDQHDPAGALAVLDTLKWPGDNPRSEMQLAMLRSDALREAGQPDSARAVLEALARKYPDNRMIQRFISRLK